MCTCFLSLHLFFIQGLWQNVPQAWLSALCQHPRQCTRPDEWMLWMFTYVYLGLAGFSADSRWWFQICVIFTPTWGNDPIWQICSIKLKPPTLIVCKCEVVSHRYPTYPTLLPFRYLKRITRDWDGLCFISGRCTDMEYLTSMVIHSGNLT